MGRNAVGIVLMGLRGSGKSTVGRALAEQIGRVFVELDERTLKRLGQASVTQAWESVGEAGFRAAEAEVLAEALGEVGAVIALGGGTPTAPGAAKMLAEAKAVGRVVVVYLRTPPSVLRDRLAAIEHDDRPALTSQGKLDEIASVFELRDPLYTELATYTVNVGAMDTDAVIKRVAALPMPASVTQDDA